MTSRLMIAALVASGVLAQAQRACPCGRSVCTCEIDAARAKREAAATPTQRISIDSSDGSTSARVSAPLPLSAHDADKLAAALAKRHRRAAKAAAIAARNGAKP